MRDRSNDPLQHDYIYMVCVWGGKLSEYIEVEDLFSRYINVWPNAQNKKTLILITIL